MVGEKREGVRGRKCKGKRRRERGEEERRGIRQWESSIGIFDVWCNKYAWPKLSNKTRFTLLNVFKESWI